MPGRVAVVTDSTAYLPADLVHEHGIVVVPLQVILDGKPFEEGAELSGHDIAEVDSTYARWNARFDESGRLVPELATV